MSIAEVEDRAVAVITLLRNGGRANDAHDMARIVAELRQSNKIEGALEGIIARCNIRWLGDMPLNNISSTQWLQALAALEGAARGELLLVRDRSSQSRKTTYEKTQRTATRRVANPKALRPGATAHRRMIK